MDRHARRHPGRTPPTDLAGFVEYARTLWTRDVHAVIADAEAIGEASTGAFPANVRRRYDRLRRFPGRYIVTGDAACSLNPVYAQGMSVAFGEALTLARVLDRHGLDRVGPRFFRQTKPITGAAWSMATGADLGHPGVKDRGRPGGACSTPTSAACSASRTATPSSPRRH